MRGRSFCFWYNLHMNFWKKLKKPFFVLAPMTDVTDSAFRQIIIEAGRLRNASANQSKPDVFYTEFVSCDGLCSEKGRPKLMPHLKFKENERPIVAQFFGSKPENFYKCAQLAVELGFDGIDINMGCPDKRVLKQGGGAALILKPELTKEIIKETKRGAGDLPVSVKTRIGFNSIITEEWISHLMEAQPAAIIVHGRTKKEMSKVPAHWDEIGKAAVICREAGITVIGNGDVNSYEDGLQKAAQYGLDGIMVGRGIFSNPWFFNPKINPASKTPEERIKLMKRHIELFTELWGDNKHPAPEHPSSRAKLTTGRVARCGASFNVMKKFFKMYITGWNGAKELRANLMKARNKEDVIKILINKSEI